MLICQCSLLSVIDDLLLCVFISELMNYKFDRKDLLCLGLCAIVGVWYLTKKVG